MSTTTMHFGPEWMRTKHQPLSRSQPPPSPPPANTSAGSGLSTYSALVSAAPPSASDSVDVVHPFRYSKEELLKIYQEGGGKVGLGLEVERWEGVVREGGTEPVTLREMTETEKKLFAGPLNSELRRRPSQSTEYLSPLNTSGLDRPRLSHNNSTTASNNSPLRERFGALKRRDSAASPSDTALPTIPRKPSLSSLQTPAMSPREAPRTRVGYIPGFDGVLNNGDSWVARKRTSEASAKIGSGSFRDPGDTHDVLASGIREEKEDDNRTNFQSQPVQDQNFFSASSAQGHSEENSLHVSHNESGSQTPPNTFPLNGTDNVDPFGNNRSDVGPPPGLFDLAAVEWSYKDPTGQIQGPFRADLMQKWYNDGYFSADLPMKRVRYDTHWTTVEELGQRAKGANIFLSPSLTPNPLGLTRGNASPLHTYPSTDNLINEPLQPAPVRSHLSSTLDSYLGTGSLSSDSPLSSIGGSHFGNPSPDSSAFGSRDSKLYYGGDTTGRLSGFGNQDRPSPFAERRVINQDFQSVPTSLNNPSFGNFSSDRDLGFNTYGYSNVPVVHDAWGMSSNLASAGFGVPQVADKMFAVSNPSTSNLPQVQRVSETPSDEHSRKFSQDALYVNQDITGFGGKRSAPSDADLTYGHYDFSSQSPFQHLQDQQVPYAAPSQEFSEGRGSGGSYPFGIPNSDPPVLQPHRPVHANTVPWSNVDATTPVRHGVMQPQASTISANVAVSPWNNLEPTTPLQVGDSAESVEPEPKKDIQKVEEPTINLAAGTIGQVAKPAFVDKPHISELESLESAVPPVKSQPSPKQAAGGKPSKPVAQASTPLLSQSPAAESAVPVVQKVAWAKEEEGKKKSGSNASVSLREIQEAEAKKLESRKTAERERERLARASASSDGKDDVQPFTASWGLPTSQAGARAAAPTTREHIPAPVQTPPAAPVWTTPLKQPVAKKTMKEIQEEEETRKKLASAKETPASVAPKRVYADTAIKTVGTPHTPNNGSAWTTVGPSGKTSAASVPSVRPPSQAPSVPTASTSKPPASPIPKVATSSVVKKSFPKQDDFPETPSHDFLKWLGDSLKGLNTSVNVEEIVSMLLSFPIDPDTSTIEIISDTIYSNSTTLDGRRFASEFVAKRKADVLARAKGVPNKTPSKPVSIADVVKATPKTAQPEWGFKVVNKKKKGGRS